MMNLLSNTARAGSKALYPAVPYSANLSQYILPQSIYKAGSTITNLGAAGGTVLVAGSPTIDANKMTVNTAGSDFLTSGLTINQAVDYTIFGVIQNLDNNVASGTQPYLASTNTTGGNGHGSSLIIENNGLAYTLSTIARASNVVTATFTAASNLFSVGQFAVIVGVTGDTTLNGSWYVATSAYSGGIVTLTYFSPGSNGSYTSQGTAIPPSVKTYNQNYANSSGSTQIETATIINIGTVGGNLPRFVAGTYSVSTGVLTCYDFTNGSTPGTNTTALPIWTQATPWFFGGTPLGNGGKCAIWSVGLAAGTPCWTQAQLSAVYGFQKTMLGQQAVVTGTIATNIFTVTGVTAGTITPNMWFTTNAAAGSCVLQQITGTTGGVGTYYVNVAQTIATSTSFNLGVAI